MLDNPRRIRTAAAYLTGLVELQDAASQRAVQMVPVAAGARVLDYCAGGGGKALAFADRHGADIFAHDIAPARMADLPDRAARRLFARFFDLGAVRALTGRDTFRLYGV